MLEFVRHIMGPAMVLIVVLIALSACRQEMEDQPRYEAYEASRLFSDSMASRHPVPGTVSRESVLRSAFDIAAEEDYPLQSYGTDTVSAGFNVNFPFPVTEEALRRGRYRFDIYCSPCHGRAGYGDGIVVQRGLRPPPSFHTDRLRAAPPAYFVNVMTDGFGSMYSYASRVAPADRWAIAAYIQALQLSQHVDADQLSAATLAELGAR